MTERLRDRALSLLAERGPMRLREFLTEGVDATTMRRLLTEPDSPIRSPARGLYVLQAPPRFDPEWEPVVEAWKHTVTWQGDAIRKCAVVCLATAARRHGLITSHPAQTWLALPHGTLAPRGLEGADDVKFVRWTRWRLEANAGVCVKDTVGAPLRVTDPERTVADLLRYSGRRGLLAQEAQEALATLMRRPERDEERLRHFCRILGAERALDLALGLRTRTGPRRPGDAEEGGSFPDFDTSAEDTETAPDGGPAWPVFK